MEPFDTLKKEWPVIKGALWSFGICVVICAVLIWGALNWLYGARIDHLTDDLARASKTSQPSASPCPITEAPACPVASLPASSSEPMVFTPPPLPKKRPAPIKKPPADETGTEKYSISTSGPCSPAAGGPGASARANCSFGPPRTPNGIYLNGNLIGQGMEQPMPSIDLAHIDSITFVRMNLNQLLPATTPADLEYKTYAMRCVMPPSIGYMASFGVVTSASYANVACEITGNAK